MVDSRKRDFQLADDQSPVTEDDESVYEDEHGSVYDLVRVHRRRARSPERTREQNDHDPAAGEEQPADEIIKVYRRRARSPERTREQNDHDPAAGEEQPADEIIKVYRRRIPVPGVSSDPLDSFRPTPPPYPPYPPMPPYPPYPPYVIVASGGCTCGQRVPAYDGTLSYVAGPAGGVIAQPYKSWLPTVADRPAETQSAPLPPMPSVNASPPPRVESRRDVTEELLDLADRALDIRRLAGESPS